MTELMENETKESLAELYSKALRDLRNGEAKYIVMRDRCAGVEAELANMREGRIKALEAENGRLKAPVSDAEWEQFAYDVRIATPTNFVHAKMMEFHQLDNLIAARAQQPSPAQAKEQP